VSAVVDAEASLNVKADAIAAFAHTSPVPLVS